jgi:hypothetical protein
VALVAPRASARTIQPLRYPIRPDTEKIVFGVDTHKHVYLGAFITFGELIETQSFPTAREGYEQLLASDGFVAVSWRSPAHGGVEQ